ncbi:MAG: hypothetical protein WA210_12875 [Burkholderiaceae bacterium]
MSTQNIVSHPDRRGASGLVTLASVVDDDAKPTGTRRTIWLAADEPGDAAEDGFSAFAPMGRAGLELRSRRYRRNRAAERQLLARAVRFGEDRRPG